MSEIKEYIDKKQLFDLVYPVGAIYLSAVAVDPAVLFGIGEWEQIEDRFLLAAGSTYNAGDTGGAATVKLSKANLPAVSGTIAMHNQGVATNIHDTTGCFSSGLTNSNKYRAGGTETSGAPSIGRINFSNGGSGTAHNNMPPYLVVYIWKRVS